MKCFVAGLAENCFVCVYVFVSARVHLECDVAAKDSQSLFVLFPFEGSAFVLNISYTYTYVHICMFIDIVFVLNCFVIFMVNLLSLLELLDVHDILKTKRNRKRQSSCTTHIRLYVSMLSFKEKLNFAAILLAYVCVEFDLSFRQFVAFHTNTSLLKCTHVGFVFNVAFVAYCESDFAFIVL